MKLITIPLIILLLSSFVSALTTSESNVVFGGIFVLLATTLFFMVISIIVNNNPMKIFFLSLSFLTLIATFGFGISIARQYFTSFDALVSTYSMFYVLLTILAGVGMIALLIWLIVIAFKAFNSYRGKSEDDD